MEGWTKLKGALKYSDVNKKTFEGWIGDGLKYVQIPSGTRFFKFSWIDEYLEQYIKNNENDIIAEEILRSL